MAKFRRNWEPAGGPPDLRSIWHGAPTLRPAIVRCSYCGREAAEGWTPERSPDDQLCPRCLALVRDPD